MDVTQVANLFASAMTLVAKYRAARLAWTEANPNADTGELPDEAPLFDLLAKDGQELKDHADEVIRKYSD